MYKRERPRPKAYLGTAFRPETRKTICLSTGRGHVMLTPEEARALADDLDLAAMQARVNEIREAA